MGLVVVDKPLTEVNVSEARKFGLTILSRSTDPNKSLYRYNDCGHTDFLQPTHVRRNNFRCKTCTRIEEIRVANKIGHTFLYKTRGTYRKYIKKCLHLSIESHSKIKILKSGRCRDCFSEKLIKSACLNSYNLVSHVGGGYWNIRFDSCGHGKKVHHGQIYKGNIVCRQCILENHISSVKKVGLDYLRPFKADITGRYNIYELPCGHEKTLREDHAEDGVYLCAECSESHYTKSSQVYLLKFTLGSFSWLKIGFAKNIETRASNYGVAPSAVKEILVTVPFSSGYRAMEFEKAIHKKYKAIRYGKSKMIKYHKFNGFTECYPLSALSILQTELESVNE